MIRPGTRPFLFLSAALAALTQPSRLTAQVTYPQGFDDPVPLSASLGPLTRRISTSSPEAQAFFDQGLQLLYAFTTQDAARSFRQAERHDPECAMCYFGEAWAWGPYLNGGMPPAAEARGYAAIQRAVQLKGRATPVERALIDAMALRYEAQPNPANRARLDTLYSNALEKVYRDNPRDLEVGTIYAESVMLLNRARGTYKLDDPFVQKIHGILDEILAIDLLYPGACHLYVHATEATARPDKAEKCAEHLGSSIPGASHINHMPSHTFNRIGRWGDAVRANQEAVISDQKAEYGEGYAIYPTHNLAMLLYAASFDGQGAVAVQAARDLSKLQAGSSQYVLTLIRFGRFDEVLERTTPLNGAARAQWDFARGYAFLKLEQADSARHYLAEVERAAQGASGVNGTMIGLLAGILRGETLLSQGRSAEAIAALEAAAALEDQLPYAEPGQLPFSSRHWLGAALLEANRPADAEKVYRDELFQHPRNGWSLWGLAQALTAQGKTAEAEEVRKQLTDSWSRADTLLRSSRF
jgi:tetratricopeptide (TPR) repeat protein